MAHIVNNPLSRFRKHDRPLHARWGDVAITAPTEGSWCQYDSAHQSAQKRRGYGPGYVPEGRPRVLPSKPKQHKDHDEEYDNEESSTSLSQRSSSAINNLNPRRLSMLLSRPKPVEGGGGGRQQHQRDIESGVDFAYKPIKHDYSTEVAEISHNRRSRFRYIPASPPYGDLEAIGPRSQSAAPYDRVSRIERSDGPRRHQGHSALWYEDDVDDYDEEENRDRRAYRGSFYPRRMVGSEKKKRYSSRRMTTVMVPDAEDIYG